MELPKSRKIARVLGEKYYFTGEACVHGHVAKRYTVNGLCCGCSKLHDGYVPVKKRLTVRQKALRDNMVTYRVKVPCETCGSRIVFTTTDLCVGCST